MTTRDIVNRAYRSVVAFAQTLISLMLMLGFSRRCAYIEQFAAKKNALVLGNGPSLAEDLQKIGEISKCSGADIWVVNNFAFSKEFDEICPAFYVLADPNYWRDNISSDALRFRESLVSILNSKVVWPMQLLIPRKAKHSRALSAITSKSISIAYYNSTPVNGFLFFRHWVYSRGLGMPSPLNVLVAALSLAAIKKYSNIFIVGADHSWHEELVIGELGRVLVTQKHFYNEVNVARPVFKTGSEEFSIGDLFLRWGEVFKLYEILKEYGDSRNLNFINSSSKSYIDAFERRGLDLLFTGEGK